MNHPRSFALFLAAITATPLLLASTALGAVNFDFETDLQYSNNFRKFYGVDPAQTGSVDNFDYLRVSAAGSLNAATIVYDTTPADAVEKSVFTVTQATPLTISADVNFSTANSSFGIYIIDSNNEGAGYLALLNIDSSSTTDRIRLFDLAAPSTGGVGSSFGAGTAYGDYNGDAFSLGSFGHITVTYSIDEFNTPVLSMTAGDFNASIPFGLVGAPLTSVEIGFRLSSQAPGSSTSTLDVDNIQLSQVPEPSAVGLVTGAGALVAGFSRRRRLLA